MTRPPEPEHSLPPLEAIDSWYQSLPSADLQEIIVSPARIAVCCVNLIAGLCYEGPLASPRVAAIVPSIVALFRRARDLGVLYYLLPQDGHTEGATEFKAFGLQAITTPEEAETVPELRQLPFSPTFYIFPRNSIHAVLRRDLDDWIDVYPGVNTYIVVGAWTDVWVYQLAMHLRLGANAMGARRRIIVPANCVDTYDMPADRARELGVLPRDGDLLHRLFLYHMALNQIEVVRELA